jgi:hypothetical protein
VVVGSPTILLYSMDNFSHNGIIFIPTTTAHNVLTVVIGTLAIKAAHHGLSLSREERVILVFGDFVEGAMWTSFWIVHWALLSSVVAGKIRLWVSSYR